MLRAGHRASRPVLGEGGRVGQGAARGEQPERVGARMGPRASVPELRARALARLYRRARRPSRAHRRHSGSSQRELHGTEGGGGQREPSVALSGALDALEWLVHVWRA